MLWAGVWARQATMHYRNGLQSEGPWRRRCSVNRGELLTVSSPLALGKYVPCAKANPNPEPIKYKERRDYDALAKWSGVCHYETGHKGYKASSPSTTIFASNATHALTPETIIGPYFVTGEMIRANVTESQPGVPLHLDVQFIDIDTCSPVPDMLVDMWQANAAGVYSGIGGQGGGAGLNTTFLRGVQPTDKDGVVQFDTIFPGHYYGRATHVHVVSRRGGKVLENGTYTGGTVNHVGQLYFDQALITVVENMEPYFRNLAPLTANRQDFLTEHEASAEYDPFMSYVSLSDDAKDGLLAWITIGINATVDHSNLAVPAASYQKGGGVACPKGWNPINETQWPAGKAPFPGNVSLGGQIPGYPTPKFPPPSATSAPVRWGPCLGS